MRFCTCIAFAAVSLWVSSAAYSQESKAALPAGNGAPIANWVAENALPLNTLDLKSGPADLEPFKRQLEGVKVFGLGEGTHGTEEFFEFKTRMVQFLARELNFNVVAMEMSYPVALQIDHYVRTGEGDLDHLLAKQGLWAWDTREITNFFRWMRAYNESQPEGRKIRFVGFDIQDNEDAVTALKNYLAEVDQPKLRELEPLFALLYGSEPGRQQFDYLANVALPERTRVMHTLIELLGYLQLNENRLVALSSEEKLAQAVWYAQILAEFADMYQQPMSNRDQVRDYYMADTLQRIAQNSPGTKVVVWAHNLHIGILQHNMGKRLREKFGNAYYALGSTFDQGGFQARALARDLTIGKLTSFTVSEAPAGTVEWYFRQAGIPKFILNFRGGQAPAPVASWLQQQHSIRSIGLGYLPHAYSNWLAIQLPVAFDGLVFFENVNAAHPNPTGNRTAAWKAEEKNQ